MARARGSRPSSYDVARLAGVSQATVSLVLNRRTEARIPDSTRQRVLAAASELGYVASASARSLATGRTRRIGFLPSFPEIAGNPYFHRIMAGMIDEASSRGYGLLLHTGRFADDEECLQEVLGGATDAVVLLGRDDSDTLTERVVRAKLPVIAAAYNPRIETISVDIDKVGEGRMIAEHLVGAGIGEALVAMSSMEDSWSRELLAGLRSVDGLELTLELGSYQGDEAVTWSRRGVKSVVMCEEHRARFAVNDLQRAGLSSPNDLRIVSVLNSDSDHPDLIAGPIEPQEELGRMAISRAIALLEGEEIPTRTLLPVTWLAGQSL